jgi:hypothetical protein
MNRRQWFTLGTWLAVVVAAPASLLACEQGAQGDRCNPDLVDTTECNSGLSCVTPSSCVISVCCPSSPPYTDPQCECFVHPEGCACSVDAAYDGMPVASASDAALTDAGGARVDSGKDATHE